MRARLINCKRLFNEFAVPVLTTSQSFWAWIINISILIIGMANSIVLARILGPEGRGELAAILLWPTLLMYLSSVGLIDAILFYAASPGIRLGRLCATAAMLALGQSLVAMLAGYLLLPTLLNSQRSDVIAASRVYLLIVPIGLVTQYCISIIQAMLDLKVVNILRSIVPAGYLLGTVALVLLRDVAPIHIVYLLLALNISTMLYAVVALPMAQISSNFRADTEMGLNLLRYGVKVFAGSVTQGANLRLDQVLIAAWLPATQLGLYVAAVSSAGILNTVSQATSLVMTPTITRQHDPIVRLNVLVNTFRRFWFIGLGMTPFLGLAMYWLVPIVYGAGFERAIWPTEVLLLGSLMYCAKEVLSSGARALGDPWLASRSEVVAFVATLILLAALLPALGIIGAAIASLISYGIALLVVLRGLNLRHAAPTGHRLSVGLPSNPKQLSVRIRQRLAEERHG